jgi:hyperosmotically inducible periplasmic protein
MKISKNIKLIGISMLLIVVLAACDNPGPAETAGKNIDRAADATGKNFDDAGKKMVEAGKKIGAEADKVGIKLAEQSATADVAINDTEITARVKAAIFAEPDLKTLQISVDTVKGLVTLRGSVDSLSSSDKAKTLASAVANVREVDNRLVVVMVN